DPMRLIPVQLRYAYRSAPKPNSRHALHLPPSGPPVQSTQPREVPDTPAHRDRLDQRDLTDDLKGHPPPLWLRGWTSATKLMPHNLGFCSGPVGAPTVWPAPAMVGMNLDETPIEWEGSVETAREPRREMPAGS